MNTLKIRGVIIKEVCIRETDKILTVFAKGRGTVVINAKGCRKSNSKLLAGTSLFSYCDFIISKNNKFNNLMQVDMIRSFHSLTKNYENIFIASYLVENCYKGLLDNEINDNILKLLIASLNYLSNGKVDNKIIISVFELKFLQFNGYEPYMENCSCCENIKDTNYIGVEGIICGDCKKSCHKKINETIKYSIKYILNSDIKRSFEFKIPKKDIKSMNEITNMLLLEQMDYKLNSLYFLK